MSIVHKQTLEPLNLAPEIKDKWYVDDDYHILFYAKWSKSTPSNLIGRARRPALHLLLFACH